MRAALVCLFGIVLSFSAYADEARHWLNRLLEAEHTQSFQGTFIYERSGSFSTHTIWRNVAEDGRVWERLLQLDGILQETVMVDGVLQCTSSPVGYSAGEDSVWPVHSLDPEKLAQWYDIEVQGNSRVADRAAIVLSLIPHDQHRYVFKVYLDQVTGLLLKSMLLSEDGNLLERFQFTQLDTMLSAYDVRPGAACQPVQPISARDLTPGAWQIDWLPPGFDLVTTRLQRSSVSDKSVAYLMYDDGLAHFSIFLEPLHDAGVDDIRSQLGPTAVVSRRMSTNDGDVMVTIVGEIPLGTAERIALSIHPGNADD